MPDPSSANPHMAALHFRNSGSLENFYGDLAAFPTNQNYIDLVVKPKKTHLAKQAPKPKKYEEEYIVGSSVHDMSKRLENSVVELDQKQYGSKESLHTIAGINKSDQLSVLAHLSKSISIDHTNPNAPLSEVLKKRIDEILLCKAQFITYLV
ncbi:hypothetical protein JT195_07700 [Helicobacter pylori]|nr:hypothetical protein [Helicobacter pylori]